MNVREFLYVLLLCACTQIVQSQNLLDTSTWTIGSGSVTGFSQNGSTSENSREHGLNHVGENVILWKAVPDNVSGADGGWNSNYITIDNTKKYRLSVWIKKTNSNDGTTYFGCQQWQSDTSIQTYTILNLNNSVNTNPYFWSGDLPKLDRWYLLVGFVREKTSTATVNTGAIYDGLTGKFVQNITDYKFHTSTNKLRHRAYLYYDTNTSDRQYFYAPRIEQINGNELSITELLSLHPLSSLDFQYDNAGNQSQRFYCPDSANCISPIPPLKTAGKDKADDEEDQVDATDISEDYDGKFIMYPNPTKDIVSIKIGTELHKKIVSIKVYNINSSLVQTLKINNYNQDLEVDLTGKPSGVYFLHIHLNDGSPSITRKIIKE